ncbi:TPA: prepilin peptidase [Enterobacter kobei]|nr:prepilin peptidase [Enterobacter kobei]HDT4959026.1 prepilin peptidase [Enterobacter kobei]
MHHNAALWLMFSAFALSVGSFLNVVIYRLPQNILHPEVPLTLALPRSHCPYCKTPLRLRDNLPLIGWLRLRGRCFHCQHPISVRYPATELLTLVCSALLAIFLPWDLTLGAALLLCWMLLALVLIDLEHQLLPDTLTLPLLWAGLLAKVSGILPGSLDDAILGAAAGYLTLWLLATLYRHWRGIDALGMGDAKLLAAFGAWLGWQALPTLLLLAAAGGIVVTVAAHLLQGRDLHQPVPFGPFLSLAGAGLFIAALI